MNKREKIQSEATEAIKNNQFKGIVEVAPRVGKCKIVIDALNTITKELKILVLAPKTPIFQGWKTDIVKWNLRDDVTIDYVWSNSLKKNTEHYDLIVADEIHEYNEKVLRELQERQRQGMRVLALTGTLDGNSKDFINFWIGISPIYTYTVAQAIEDKIVADYKIYCIECELDDEDKHVLSGSEENPFLQTEAKAYEYWNNKYNYAVSRMQYRSLKFLMSKRKDIIYNSKTKLNIAKKLTEHLDRCIVFTGLQKVADQLGEGSYHSKSDKNALIDFQEGKIDKLAVVSMISMGITIPNLKTAIFNQLKSGENLAVQQAMRTMNIDGDKLATIYIIYLKGTRDEDWIASATKGFDESKITYCTIDDIIN